MKDFHRLSRGNPWALTVDPSTSPIMLIRVKWALQWVSRERSVDTTYPPSLLVPIPASYDGPRTYQYSSQTADKTWGRGGLASCEEMFRMSYLCELWWLQWRLMKNAWNSRPMKQFIFHPPDPRTMIKSEYGEGGSSFFGRRMSLPGVAAARLNEGKMKEKSQSTQEMKRRFIILFEAEKDSERAQPRDHPKLLALNMRLREEFSLPLH